MQKLESPPTIPGAGPVSTAPLPSGLPDELARLRSLYGTQYLDSPSAPRFDVFTRLAAQICGTPISAISLIAADRAWTLSTVGLPQGINTPREDSFCARCSTTPGGILIVEDAAQHPDLRSSPLVTGPPWFRFYAGSALRDEEGHALGVLCVVDRKARTMSSAELGALNDLAAGVSAILQRDKKLAAAANHESPLGLPGRAALASCLAKRLEAAQFGGPRPTIAHVDIVDYGAMRATLSPSSAGKLLRQFAIRLSEAFHGAELIAQLGADHFAVLLPPGTEPTSVGAMVEEAIGLLTAPIPANGGSKRLNISVGVAAAAADERDPHKLLAQANLARLHARMTPEAEWRLYEPGMALHGAPGAYGLDRDAGQALRRGELYLAYQPIVSTFNYSVASFEALLRWDHPQFGNIPPGEFIPLAEKHGSILEIGNWVLREACLEASGWPQNIAVAVNVSARQVHADLPRVIEGILKESKLSPARLILEVTETTALEDSAGNAEVLKKIRSLGVRLALDDFGTGHASLNYLLRFPFDEIKIDRAFIHRVLEHKESQAIVQAVVGMARTLGISVVAEGVECAEQLHWLRENGCDQVQGFFFGKPMSAESLVQFTRSFAAA